MGIGRPCTICQHPKRNDIDKALVAGEPCTKVAQRFDAAVQPLRRHSRSHLRDRLKRAADRAEVKESVELARYKQAKEAEEIREALDVVEQLREINEACRGVLRDAKQTKQVGVLLRAVDRIHRQVELQARLLGELPESPTVEIILSPEWDQVRAVVLTALAPHPEARTEVAKALMAFADAGS